MENDLFNDPRFTLEVRRMQRQGYGPEQIRAALQTMAANAGAQGASPGQSPLVSPISSPASASPVRRAFPTSNPVGPRGPGPGPSFRDPMDAAPGGVRRSPVPAPSPTGPLGTDIGGGPMQQPLGNPLAAPPGGQPTPSPSPANAPGLRFLQNPNAGDQPVMQPLSGVSQFGLPESAASALPGLPGPPTPRPVDLDGDTETKLAEKGLMGVDRDFYRWLLDFGMGMMAAGGQPGATFLGAAGQAGLSATAAADQRQIRRDQQEASRRQEGREDRRIEQADERIGIERDNAAARQANTARRIEIEEARLQIAERQASRDPITQVVTSNGELVGITQTGQSLPLGVSADGDKISAPDAIKTAQALATIKQSDGLGGTTEVFDAALYNDTVEKLGHREMRTDRGRSQPTAWRVPEGADISAIERQLGVTGLRPGSIIHVGPGGQISVQ